MAQTRSRVKALREVFLTKGLLQLSQDPVVEPIEGDLKAGLGSMGKRFSEGRVYWYHR